MDEATTENIDAVLEFLPTFEAGGYQPGEWRSHPGQFPYFLFDEKLIEFVGVLYQHGWVISFDWPAWRETAARYTASPEAVAGADLDVIRRLFATHVRQDRFCDGHLAEMVRDGHIVALLRRLAVIRTTAGASG